MVGEKDFGGQQANLALQPDGDSLPGAKMAGIYFRRRGGRPLEEVLVWVHGNMLPDDSKYSVARIRNCVYDSHICDAETL